MRIFITWLVALSLNVQMFGISHAAQTSQVSAETKAVAARYAKGFAAARDSIELKYFDVDARSEALGYDVDAAADFVVNAIAYDPYIGVLRGPEGTLSAQAGSAWDQAVTLSALINAMGGESMIAQGTLTKDDAERLIAQHFVPRQPLDAGITIESIAKAMQGHVRQDAIDTALALKDDALASNEGADTDAIVAAVTSNLLSALNKAGKAIPQSLPADAFIEQIAEDYAWVRYRDTPNDPWKVVHPAFGAANTPNVDAERFVADTVPPEKLHLIKIELDIERFENGKVKREKIMTAYERPVANQASQQISLAIAPNNQTAGPNQEAGFFLPLLNGQLPVGAQAFTLLGLTAPAEDALGGPAIFATVANRFGGALSGLDDRKEGETPAIGLAGVILKVSHTAPGEKPVVAQRRLSDFRPDAPQGLGSMSSAVVFDGVIDVSVGAENKARDYRNLFDANAKRAAQMPLLLAVSTGKISMEDYIAQDEEIVTDQSWGDMTVYGEAFAPNRGEAQSVVRQGPLVVMHRLQQSGGAKGQLQSIVDIMLDDALGLNSENGGVSLAPEASLRLGASETLMEGAMVGKQLSDSWVTAALGEVIANEAALDTFVSKGGITQGMAERLAADFAHSGLLILSQDDGPLRWWRVSAQTGKALGMSYHGGSELAEYEKLTNAVGLMVAGTFAAKGAVACNESYENDPGMLACCQAGNALMLAGGIAAGMAAGGALAANTAKDAALAGLGYFTTMMTWEFTVDVAAATVGGAIADAACSRIVK